MTSQSSITLIAYTLVICSILLVLIKSKRSKSKKHKNLPPGPPKLPILGNLHQLKSPLHVALLELSKQYGDLMYLKLGFVPTIVLSSSDIVREVFKTHDLAFSGRPNLHVASRMGYDNSNIVFCTYGEHWREVKKIAVLELLSTKRVQSYYKIREDEVAKLIDSISRCSGPFDLSKFLHGLANNMVCRVAFGKQFQGGRDGKKSLQDMLHETQDLIASICLSDFFPSLGWVNRVNGFEARLDKNWEEFDELFDKVIEDHDDPKRAKPEHEDLVDVLLRLKKESKHVTNKVIKAIISDMFIAGTDTSSATLVWAMTELIRNPKAMQRTQEEVRRVAKGKEKVEESDLPQLIFLRAVVKETLRVHLPSPLLIPRETMEDCKIRGYDIPAKTRVFINATAISMDPKIWEDPYEFRPERFLDNSIDFRGQHFELIPFGVGRRMCPGMNFALPVLELTLANLLYRFNWELPPGVTRENMNVEEALGFTVLKETPLVLVASPVMS
nr:cytochrome P450 monooxygenase 10 [Garcinia xanthochymus]